MYVATRLKLFKQDLDKRKNELVENFDLSTYLNTLRPKIISTPFPHVVVDNFFKDEVYDGILDFYNSVRGRGLSEVNDPNRFQPFLELKGAHAYDGYVHIPDFEESDALKIFYSATWNRFFSSLFKQPTGWETALALHYHPAGDKTGWVHHDYSTKPFLVEDTTSSGVIYRSRGNLLDPRVIRKKRIIALIFYLGNDDWKEGDGGETGLYASKNGNPVSLIEPKNNRLFAFQISPNSFHAFQGNNTPRASLIQWFHVDEEWTDHMYGRDNVHTANDEHNHGTENTQEEAH